jgi:iron complex transport system ATP-binding protein
MTDPELLILDEPSAGLDVAGREDLVYRMSQLASDEEAPTLVLVTHHLEEIPPGFTHALLMNSGRIVAAGTMAETMTEEKLSAAYGMELAVRVEGGRYSAFARR